MADLKSTTIDGGLRAWENDAEDPNLILTTTDQGEYVDPVDGLAPDTSIAVGRLDAREKVHVEGAVEAWEFRIGERYVGDRLSQLENLLPTAPVLDQYTSTGGANGNLSFDGSNTITGVTVDPNTSRNGLFGNGSEERGIIDGTTDVSGTLNDDVGSTSEHNADVFGRATEGVLVLIVNGSEITAAEADLDSTTSAINTVTGNNSGFVLSAASDLSFPSGDPFTGSQQRSGTWQVGSADLVSGYNTVQVRHETDTGTLIGETPEIEYVVDDDGNAIAFSSESLGNLNTTGSKDLSGINYHTAATADFTALIDNVYRNTYADGNAITFPTTTRCSVSSQSIPALSGGDDETTQISLTAGATVNATYITDQGISVAARVTDPVESAVTSTTASDFSLLIDAAGGGNGDLAHNFNDESHRLPSNLNFDNDLGTSAWDSTNDISDSGPAGYNDGIQVTEGELVYPSVNYSAIADGPSGNPDYSTGVSGERTYYGLFTDSTATSNWSLEVQGSGTLVQEGTLTNGTDEVAISIRLPDETGWMDVSQNFVTGQTSDGDGAFQATNGNNQNFNGNPIGITTGVISSSSSFDKLYYRITVPQGWTGNITDFDINWPA